jgi:hypothetical protein
MSIRFYPLELCKIYLLIAAPTADCQGSLYALDETGSPSSLVPIQPIGIQQEAGSTCVGCLPERPSVDIGLFQDTTDGPVFDSVGQLAILSLSNGSAFTAGFKITVSSAGCSFTLLAATGVAPPAFIQGPSMVVGEIPTSSPVQPPSYDGTVPAFAPTNVPEAAPTAAPAVVAPTTNPVPPAVGCAAPQPAAVPGLIYSCVNGTWVATQNITITSATIPTFTISSTGSSTVTTTGCVSISNTSVVVIEIDSATANDIATKNGSTGTGSLFVLFQSLAECLSGKFSSVTVKCADGATNNPGCSPGCVQTDQRESTRSLSVLLTAGPTSSNGTCGSGGNEVLGGSAGVLWWHILIAVLGSILVVGVIVGVIYASPKLRRKVFPFLERRHAPPEAAPME